MIGDLLLIHPAHRKAAQHILLALEDKTMKGLVLAIGGESGSGKSEVAHLLRRQLKKKGIEAKLIHTDNYYITLPTEREEWRKQREITQCVGPQEYRWDLLNSHVSAFRKRVESVELPFIDVVTDQIDTLITSFSLIDVLIVEGLYATGIDADFRVILDVPYHDTVEMQTLREKVVMNSYRLEVLEAERRAIAQLLPQADLVLGRSSE